MPRPDRIMEHNKNNQYNGLGNGFLLGVIVGAILTLLFTTKKGREILKELLEKGVEKFSNLEDLMRDTYVSDLVDDDFEEEDDFVPTQPVTIVDPPKVKKEPENKPEQVTKPNDNKEINVAVKTVKQPMQQNHPDSEKKDKPELKFEEKQKNIRGKRWFRGLRKKN